MALQPHAHKLRSGRHSQPGQVYLLTTVTEGREPVFSDFGFARMLIAVLREQQDLQHAQTLAFVVMPDHLHWLMQLGERIDLPLCMRTVKTMSARRIGRPIWQRGYHDHALRQEQDLADVARYVIANPVRAGLVTRTGQYPHWDAVWV